MVWSGLIVFGLMLAACDEHGSGGACTLDGRTYNVGDVFPAGDGCNSCSCSASGIACTERACSDGGVDASPFACAPAGGCPNGPVCGGLCCGTGEKCVGDVCACGTGPVCTTGNSCEAAGPIGTDACGSICCGASGPCPL